MSITKDVDTIRTLVLGERQSTPATRHDAIEALDRLDGLARLGASRKAAAPAHEAEDALGVLRTMMDNVMRQQGAAEALIVAETYCRDIFYIRSVGRRLEVRP